MGRNHAFPRIPSRPGAVSTPRARLRGRAAVLRLLSGTGIVLLAGACGSGAAGGGRSPGIAGQELEKTGGGTLFVEPDHAGGARRVLLAEMFWARVVDVHDVDEEGRVRVEPAFRDFAIDASIQSDGRDYRLETNPITQETRLVILRTRGAP